MNRPNYRCKTDARPYIPKSIHAPRHPTFTLLIKKQYYENKTDKFDASYFNFCFCRKQKDRKTDAVPRWHNAHNGMVHAIR